MATGKKVFAFNGTEFAGSDQLSALSGGALIADCPWFGEGAMAPRIWDLETKRLLLVLPQERALPSCFAWSPNKEFLAVGLPGGELGIWSLPKIKAQLDELGLGW